MNYKPEELLAVVQGLSEQFTGKASTSITYETAQQLMGAVIYCIQEAERGEKFSCGEKEFDVLKQRYDITKQSKLTAGEAYETGYEAVLKKTGAAKEIYHKILAIFQSFGNCCLEDAVKKGMPEFFKWYDPKYSPQDAVILMDYPVLFPIGQMQGIDAVYIYLKAILTEQLFLKRLANAYVRKILELYCYDHEEMIVNITYPLIKKMLVNLLLDIPLQRMELTEKENDKLRKIVKENEKETLEAKLKGELKFLILAGDFLQDISGLEKAGMQEYFCCCIPDLATELKNGGSLD